MLKSLKKSIAVFMAVIVAVQPILAANGYKHHVYIPGLRVTGDTTVDPSNPGGGSENAADLVLSTNTLSFVDTEVGREVSLQIQVTNYGADTPLNIQTGTAVFAATHNCGTSLVKNESCIINVRFAPNAGKLYNETLTVAPLTGITKTATLAGRGLGAVLSPSPIMLSFDDTFISLNQVKTLTLTNTGNRSALMGGVSFESTGFTVDSNNCIDELAIGQSCTIGVKFEPTSSGSKETTMSISANTGVGGTAATVGLRGVGLDTPLSMAKTKEFDPVEVGTSVTKGAFIYNRGAAPLTIDVVNVTGEGFSGSGCTGVLSPGARCDVPVTFAPTDAGTFTGELRVSQGGKSSSTTLTGVGTKTAVPQLNPSSLSFGSVIVGTPTNPQTVTLKNAGTTTLGITRNTQPESYEVSTQCPSSLAPGESCDYQIVANAVKNGPQNKTVIVYTSAGAQSIAVTSTATGGLDQFLLSSENLALPDTDVGSTSTPVSVLIKNVAAQPVDISSITVSAPFAATTSCGEYLDPNEECAISVTFTPDAAKLVTKSIIIKSALGTTSIPASGRGVAPELTIAPLGLDFGNIAGLTDIPSQVLDVKASGGKEVAISGITVTNSAFTQTNNCPETLPSNSSCKIVVAMTPGVEGLSQGNVYVQSNSASSPTSATLSAANNTYVAKITNSVIDFGSVSMSDNVSSYPTATVTITNTGVAPMTLSGASPDSEEVVVKSHNCTNIAPQASCTMTVALSLAKPKSIQKTMKTRGPGANAEFIVKGLVQGVSARWINGGLDFGFVAVGSSSTQTVALSNQGNINANFSSIQLTNPAFTATSSGCTSVAPRQLCNVSITYTPTASSDVSATAAGISSAGLFIWTGDPLVLRGSSILKKLTASTNEIDIGTIIQGQTSAVKTVQVLNESDIPLTGLGVTAPDGFIVTTDCPTDLPVGVACNISVKLNTVIYNKKSGNFSANLSVRASQASAIVKMVGYLGDTLTLKSSSLPNIVTPVDLTFGRVDLGTSKSMDFYVLAQGSAGKLVTSASITGPNAADFTWTKAVKINPTTREESSCGATITGNSFTSCTSDQFTFGGYSSVASAQLYTLSTTAALPTGDKSATLTLSYSDGTTEVLPITVAVPSLANAAVSTDNLQFSPTDANTTSQLTVRLSNTGTENLIIKSAPALSGSAVFTFPATGGTNCGASLAPGAFCDTTINFKPIDESTSTATLTINTNDFDGPTVVNISGTGLQGVGSITAQNGSLGFGVVPIGNKVKKIYQFNNIGTKAVTGTYATLTGNPSSMTLVTAESTCGTAAIKTSVAAGASCAITIEYAPTMQGEVLSAVDLTVYSTARNSPVVQSISGSAGGTVTLNVTDTSNVAITSYNFGAVNKGASPTYTIKYTNAGTAPVLFNSVPTLTGASVFTSTGNTCTSTLAVGANCTVTVKFSPTAIAEATATVSATYNGGNSSVTLKGTGNIPSATFTGASYAFGTVLVGSSVTNTFTVTNTGNVSLSGLTSAITDPTVTIQSTTCTTIAPSATCSVVLKYAPTSTSSLPAGIASFKLTAFSANDVTFAPPTNLSGTGYTITYQTWSPTEKAASVTLSNGNLTATSSGTGSGVRASMSASTGVKYYEMRIDSVNTGNSNGPTSWFGFAATTASYTSGVASNSSYVGISGQTTGSTGTWVGRPGSAASISVTLKVGDIVGLRLDLDNRVMQTYVNGVLKATTTAATNAGIAYHPIVAPQMAQTTVNFGQSPFQCQTCQGSATTWSQ